jgi:ADP-ribose pyrophosphatase
LDAEPASALDPAREFLRIVRLHMKVSSLPSSARFDYDIVTRDALDAVVIAAHFMRGGIRHVMLRSAVRPPLWHRDPESMTLWELPAGLVEPGESPRDAAARELYEEVGAKVSPDALLPLGPALYPAPGMVAELQSYFHVAIDPAKLEPAQGDASALEQASLLHALPVAEALALCAAGAMPDLKTELGLRRLSELG